MTREKIVYGLSLIAIAWGIATIFRLAIQEAEARAAQDNLADLRDRKSSHPILRILRPLALGYFFPFVKDKPVFEPYRANYRQKIVSAGLREDFQNPDEYIAFKLTVCMLMPAVLMFFNIGLELDFDWSVILVVSPALGWFFPDYMLGQLTLRRQVQALKSLPFIVDLLALSTEAGLDFMGAIAKVVEKAKPSPLVEELTQVLKELRLGTSRQEALRQLGVRLNMTEINSFIAILISADQMGASIGKILRQQSEQIRLERMVRAEKAGARAAQLIILPVMMFILPAVFLLIASPFVVQWVKGGG